RSGQPSTPSPSIPLSEAGIQYYVAKLQICNNYLNPGCSVTLTNSRAVICVIGERGSALQSMKKLIGKTAIVTGASRGIGRSIAERLAEDGAQVVLAARDTKLLEEAAAWIGSSAAWIATDLREKDAPARVVEFALSKFSKLDIVVNNAGATKR